MKLLGSAILLFYSCWLFAEPTQFTTGNRQNKDIIVKYKEKSKGASTSGISSTKAFIKYSIGARDIKKIKDMNIDHLRIEEGQNLEKTIDEINSLPEVEFAEPDYLLKVNSVDYDIDSFMPKFLVNEWGLLSIKANQAWEITTGSRDIVVAVIDSGIDYNHQDLQGNIWINPGEDINGDGVCDESDFNNRDNDKNGYANDCIGWNFVDDNNDPYDDLNHGTHVAGIIGGRGNPEVFGVSRVVKLMAVKFIAGDGYGTTSDAISSIIYAVKNGARILNNSWGGAHYSRSLKEVINYSNNNNTIFLAAAGNSGTNNDITPHYPSNYRVQNIISVGASMETDDMPMFSNFGFNSVNIVAPGTQIYSTISEDRYSFYSGTSMATPFVAGIAALVLSKHPALSNYDLKRIILESTDQVPQLSAKVLTSGRVNAQNALFLANSGLSGSAKYPMVSRVFDPNERGREVSSTVGCGRVSETKSHSSDFLFVIITVLLPLVIVIGRKKRNRAYARIAKNYCRYLVKF